MRQFCADNTDVSEKVRLLGFLPPIEDVVCLSGKNVAVSFRQISQGILKFNFK